ncbi:hypothetical protein [Streptomyces ipomoeae]|uniref:hypothetical protein n=1 Tax=Streptomyces ipomoeae TaxID=103232 RepID=UPI001146E823|nr:hypothetical protein [Streptomyces ipomoeae]MDX2936857.1 hypothetical protein [Streptomyces ipomoeae]TQE23879.1 hypothetical protein SipoB123_20355 [Streptomyces ipomoeae]
MSEDVNDGASREPAVRPEDAVMATFSAWLDHAVACKDACRRKGVVCLPSVRLGKEHREARRAASRARRVDIRGAEDK